MTTKIEIGNIASFIREEYELELEKQHWGRIGSLIKRVGYDNLFEALLSIPNKKTFNSVSQFLNYVQFLATDLAIRKIENEDDSGEES